MSRSVKKGPFVSFHIIENITSINKKGLKRVIHTWSRSSIIIPIIIGHTISVYNGNHHVPVFIKDTIVGHKLGEFVRTRLHSKHPTSNKNIKHLLNFMGQKIHPTSIRMGITQRSSSHWYADTTYYSFFLGEDRCINTFISKFCDHFIISDIHISRKKIYIRIRIHVSKFRNSIIPDKKYLEKLRRALQKTRQRFFSNYLIGLDQWESFHERFKNTKVTVFVCLWKHLQMESSYIRAVMVSELEKRIPFRLVIRSRKELRCRFRHILGIRIQVSGRLNGAEIARSEKICIGNIPLLTFSALLDFSSTTAYTTYGVLGVKVWVFHSNVNPA